MNINEMKEDFYKRFEDSDSYLKQENCGLLCTLLGFPNIKGAMSLTYPLSVGVTGLCRSSDSDTLLLEKTDSGVLYSQRIKGTGGLLPDDVKIKGGEILLNNEIPKYFNSAAEIKCCTLKCVMSLNGYSRYDVTAAAASCCGRENIKPYLALLNARPGYCVKSEKLKTECLPLPLSGFKLVSIQIDKPDSSKDDYDKIEHEIDCLKNYYPHMTAISDLTLHDLDAVRTHISDKQTFNRLSMIIRDNERILSAAAPLRACRTSELFNQMNLSAKDYLRLWGLESQYSLLLRTVLETEGVRATRFWNKGVIAVAYEERIDYILSMTEAAFKNNGEHEIKFCISN